jgi:hypothetical protein
LTPTFLDGAAFLEAAFLRFATIFAFQVRFSILKSTLMRANC